MSELPPFDLWVKTTPCATAIGGAGGTPVFMEALTVTLPNTLSNTTNTPTGGFTMLVVNGMTFLPVGTPPPFTVSGNTINWASPVYSINPGDSVVIAYAY